jgi:hypothetical protein
MFFSPASGLRSRRLKEGRHECADAVGRVSTGGEKWKDGDAGGDDDGG